MAKRAKPKQLEINGDGLILRGPGNSVVSTTWEQVSRITLAPRPGGAPHFGFIEVLAFRNKPGLGSLHIRDVAASPKELEEALRGFAPATIQIVRPAKQS